MLNIGAMDKAVPDTIVHAGTPELAAMAESVAIGV